MRRVVGVVLILGLAFGCGENGDKGAGEAGGTGRTEGETEGAMGVRKQVYDLMPRDLQQFAVWEFALDEEGEAGQDEATVKPRPDLGGGVNPDDGLFIVRAEFKAANGASFDGFVTPDPDGDLDATQPSVVTGKEHVSFWFGIAEPEPQEIERSYSALGVERGQLFPMTFETAVPVGRTPMEGKVPAFMYLDENGNTRQID